MAETALVRGVATNTAELSAAELSEALLAGQITPEEHRGLLRATDNGSLEAKAAQHPSCYY